MRSVIFKRLREPSTWAGLSAMFLVAGLSVEQAQALAQAGAALASVAAVFIGEAGK